MTGRDPEVISVKAAARIARKDPVAFMRQVREDAELRRLIVIDHMPGKRIAISRPRLLRWLHGDALLSSAGVASRDVPPSL